jgi:hypothetical protein
LRQIKPLHVKSQARTPALRFNCSHAASPKPRSIYGARVWRAMNSCRRH